MTRKLDDWLKTYLKYSQHTESPESFHFWTGIGTIAGALRKKVRMKELHYSWSPNFYIIFVAKPGILTKSTAISIGGMLLRKIKGIKFGPDAMTWQALIEEMSSSVDLIKMPDGTDLPMSCLTFTSSELGSLVDFNDRQMITVLVDLWDGREDSWKKVTKSVGSNKIYGPWINIMAATTPSWLSDNLPKTMVGGGFTSRCIFIFGSKKRQLIAYPSRQVHDMDAFRRMEDNLVHDLEVISLLKGDVTLTNDAYVWGEQWYDRHYQSSLKNVDDVGGFMARKQAHLHKVATVLSAAKRDDLVIDVGELKVADILLTAVERDLHAVFQSLQTSDGMDRVARLIEIVEVLGSISKQELYRKYFISQVDIRVFDTYVASAIHAGYIREKALNGTIIIEWAGPAAGQTPSGSPSTPPGTSSGLGAP